MKPLYTTLKLVLLATFSILTITQSLGQNWFQEGDTWVYRTLPNRLPIESYTEMKVIGDTTYDNQNVKRLQLKEITLNPFTFQIDTAIWHQYGFERNDSIFFSNRFNEIAFLYDFGAVINDTNHYQRSLFFPSCQSDIDLVLTGIEDFQLENELYKEHHYLFNDWENGISDESVRVMERIGSTQKSIFIPTNNICRYGGLNYRLCQFKTSTDSLIFDHTDCRHIKTGIDELSGKFRFHPNPVSSILFIDSSEPIEKIELYALNGRQLKSVSDIEQIDVEHLAPGVYLLKITIKGKTAVRKILKH